LIEQSVKVFFVRCFLELVCVLFFFPIWLHRQESRNKLRGLHLLYQREFLLKFAPAQVVTINKMKAKYLNLFTDFGFKKIFGEEASKPLLIDFLNALLPQKDKIVDLTFKNNEQLGQTDLNRNR
jgi:hypothetical protein